MSAIRYHAGSWMVMVRSATVVVLPTETAPSTIDTIWVDLAEGPDIEKTLRAVTSSFGGDLTGIPGFAIVVLESPLHVIIRGNIRLTCQGANPVEISGAHVTTWSEQVLFNQDAFDLIMDEGPAGEVVLPLSEGAVLASGLTATIGASLPTAPVPQPGSEEPESEVREGELESVQADGESVKEAEEPEPAAE